MSGEKSSTRPDLHAERELDQGNPLKTSDQAGSQRQTGKSLSMGPNYSSESRPNVDEEHSLRCCRVYRQNSPIELFRAFFSEIERLKAHFCRALVDSDFWLARLSGDGWTSSTEKKIGPRVFFGVDALFTILIMYRTDSLLTFSFPMGRLMGVPLRLSFLMPVVAVALMWRMQDVVFGAITSVILLLSLLAHEIAHLLVARRNYSAPGLVVLWPLGGMSEGSSRLNFRESLVQSLAGPLVNAAVAIACGWRLHELGLLGNLWNPFEVFSMGSQLTLAENCLRVAFLVNYCLTLFNLIPVRPLDAGQVASSFLNLRFVESETHDLMLRIGLVVSLFGILAGFVFDISSLVALSSFLLVLHIHQVSQWTPPPEPDDSFMGYDFSEGYTSLNRAEFSDRETEDEDSGFGILERWKTRRDDERAVRDSEVREMDEQQLDIILEKLHTEGRDSLSARELAILNRVSARLRQRNTQQ